MNSDICNHVNVKRNVIPDLGKGREIIVHVICEDCFEEWVE